MHQPNRQATLIIGNRGGLTIGIPLGRDPTGSVIIKEATLTARTIHNRNLIRIIETVRETLTSTIR
jgi:hypothetical protein